MVDLSHGSERKVLLPQFMRRGNRILLLVEGVLMDDPALAHLPRTVNLSNWFSLPTTGALLPT